jgi:hypothetical protein
MDLKPLEKLVRFYKDLPGNVLKSADTAMVNNSSELLEYNREQLKGGTDSETKPLRYKHNRKSKLSGVYTAAYSKYKGRRGGNTAYVDLDLDHTFLNSLRLDHEALGRFRIGSESKVFSGGTTLEDELMYNYGKDIFGLWEGNLQKFASENLKPTIEFEVEQLINRL